VKTTLGVVRRARAYAFTRPVVRDGQRQSHRHHASRLQKTNPSPLGNDPKFYSVSKTNSRAFGAGQLDLAIIEHMTSGRLAFDQFMRSTI
jgi:hypothetical protein